MGKPELTKQQKSVVFHDGDALLVSAAAGSGKTKVLIDRLLRKVCDPVSPCNIDDFLIITYTKAAAAELRSKIAAEIGGRLAENSGNLHLRKQLTRIYLAEISTVHAFCTGILRTYAYLLDIPAEFRVGDEGECQDLRMRAMERVLAGVYEEMNTLPNVRSFFDSLGHGRNDRRVSSLVLAAYQKIQCHAKPHEWMEKCREQLSCDDFHDITETVWGKYILRDMEHFLQQQISRMEYARDLMVGCDEFAAYRGVFENNVYFLKNILQNFSWETLWAVRPDFGRLPGIRNCQEPELQNEVKAIRDACKEKFLKKLLSFAYDPKEALAELKKTQGPLLGLLEFVERFEEEYRLLKRQRKVLDFSDLEHETIRLLTDRYTGGPTAVAKEISRRFTEIMVDEYQDSNQVQDTIFKAISKDGKNLFMVGDVKQSIYSFRLADPSIFLEKYHSFTTQETDMACEPRKILLSTNFRSRNAILDAVNHVFTAVMSEDVGDLAYGEDESLRTIRQFPDLGEPAVELHCIDVQRDSDDNMVGSKNEQEADFVAGRIAELIAGEHYISDGDGRRRICAEDIVILMRSLASTAPVYRNALAKRGIACSCEHSGQIFETTEVASLLAWLQIMDNPHQDIPLITAMASPLGGFSADELAKMRAKSKRTDLFDALVSYAETDEKFHAFLQELSTLRLDARWMTLTELFDRVCDVTDVFSVFGAMDDGVARVNNLKMLRDFCCNAGALGVDDLGGFLRYVETLKESGTRMETKAGTASGVTIMSIHKSKGLEFPVVFLCDLSRKFNLEDFKTSVFMDQELYIGSDIVDRELMIRYPGPAKQAISLKKKRDILSEEMRILYVAMTRAMDRLIMTYCAANVQNQIQDAAAQTSYPVQTCVAEEAKCPGQWILLSAAVRREASHLFGGSKLAPDLPGDKWLVQYHDSLPMLAVETDPVIRDMPAAPVEKICLPKEYAFAGSVKVPAKLTATQLKGRLLDEESAANAGHGSKQPRPLVRGKSALLSERGLTAAEKGTAMHLFMQYCDYASCRTVEGVAAEKKRLLEQRFLTEEQVQAVDEAKILRFFLSELGDLVTGGGEVHREFKFSVLVDAGEYEPKAAGDEIMMQGVVDCFIIQNSAITVIDYKSDYVLPGQEEQRTEVYRPQLTAYKRALQMIYGLPVTRCVVYYFATGTACQW